MLDSPFQTNTWHACHYLTQFMNCTVICERRMHSRRILYPRFLRGAGVADAWAGLSKKKQQSQQTHLETSGVAEDNTLRNRSQLGCVATLFAHCAIDSHSVTCSPSSHRLVASMQNRTHYLVHLSLCKPKIHDASGRWPFRAPRVASQCMQTTALCVAPSALPARVWRVQMRLRMTWAASLARPLLAVGWDGTERGREGRRRKGRWGRTTGAGRSKGHSPISAHLAHCLRRRHCHRRRRECTLCLCGEGYDV